MQDDKLREILGKEREVHSGHWVENLYCRVCKRKLTDNEIFDMGFNWALSQIDISQIKQFARDEWVLSEEEILDILYKEMREWSCETKVFPTTSIAEAIHSKMRDKIAETRGDSR